MSIILEINMLIEDLGNFIRMSVSKIIAISKDMERKNDRSVFKNLY
jgi:hypothetical protein